MRILGLSGSLRSGSYNTALLRAAAETSPPEVEVEVYDALAAIPPYDADLDVEPAPLPVRDLRDAAEQADAIIVATPEYNGSLPGQLKNALDWASRPYATNPFRGKPVLVIGTSTGSFGAIWAQEECRKVLGVMGAATCPEVLPVPYADQMFDDDGDLTHDELRQQLAEAVAQLVEAARERGAQPLPA